jgi:membrane protein required for colicin V production
MQPVDILDLVLVGLIAFSALRGYLKGFIRPALGLCSLVAAGLIARAAYELLGAVDPELLEDSVNRVLAFLVPFLLILAICTAVVRRIRKQTKELGLGGLDRAAGAAIGVVRVCTLLALLLVPLQTHPIAGAPLRQSLVLPCIAYGGFLSKLVLPSIPLTVASAATVDIEVLIESTIDDMGQMTRVIRVRGPDEFFPSAHTELPLRAQNWNVESQPAGSGRRELTYRGGFDRRDAPLTWPTRVDWRLDHTAFRRRLDFRESINLSEILSSADGPFQAQHRPNEDTLDAVFREWRHLWTDVRRRTASRAAKEIAVPVTVRLTATGPLTGVQGLGATVHENLARWDLQIAPGQTYELIAWQRDWGWASWVSLASVAVATVIGGVTYSRRWYNRQLRRLLENSDEKSH